MDKEQAKTLAENAVLEQRAAEWQEKDANGNYVKTWEEMEPVNVETERFNPHSELNELIESSSTVNRLRGLATKFALQLDEARADRKVQLDSSAEEVIQSQKMLIDALQLQSIRLEQCIRYFRRWLLSRDVMDLILRNKKLEEEKAELARHLIELQGGSK